MWKRQPWKVLLTLAAALTLFATGYAYSQGTIAFVGDGIIHSKDGGFMFPDGSVQASAAAGGHQSVDVVRRLSVNQGLYDNRISDQSHSADSVEICFVVGSLVFDENAANHSTAGGNCKPGDLGWIIERNERSARSWTAAKATCLALGMCLPEVFEYQLTCDNAAMIGVTDIKDGAGEWTGNEAHLNPEGTAFGLVSAVVSGGNCSFGGYSWIARQDGLRDTKKFRCVL